MPDDALPQSRPAPLPGTVRLRREYRDALGRPLTGKLTITGKNGASHGDVRVPAAPVDVELVDGVLDVSLPPDVYRISGRLSTKGTVRVEIHDEAELSAAD